MPGEIIDVMLAGGDATCEGAVDVANQRGGCLKHTQTKPQKVTQYRTDTYHKL